MPVADDSSDNKNDDSDDDESFENEALEELKRKQQHPNRLHLELWYNERGEVRGNSDGIPSSAMLKTTARHTECKFVTLTKEVDEVNRARAFSCLVGKAIFILTVLTLKEVTFYVEHPSESQNKCGVEVVEYYLTI